MSSMAATPMSSPGDKEFMKIRIKWRSGLTSHALYHFLGAVKEQFVLATVPLFETPYPAAVPSSSRRDESLSITSQTSLLPWFCYEDFSPSLSIYVQIVQRQESAAGWLAAGRNRSRKAHCRLSWHFTGQAVNDRPFCVNRARANGLYNEIWGSHSWEYWDRGHGHGFLGGGRGR
jgi:hypothetical protein